MPTTTSPKHALIVLSLGAVLLCALACASGPQHIPHNYNPQSAEGNACHNQCEGTALMCVNTAVNNCKHTKNDKQCFDDGRLGCWRAQERCDEQCHRFHGGDFSRSGTSS